MNEGGKAIIRADDDAPPFDVFQLEERVRELECLLGRWSRKNKKEWSNRAALPRGQLEFTIATAVRSDQSCEGFVGVILEGREPQSPAQPNWIVKGVCFGQADRANCELALATIVKGMQSKFDLADNEIENEDAHQVSTERVAFGLLPGFRKFAAHVSAFGALTHPIASSRAVARTAWIGLAAQPFRNSIKRLKAGGRRFGAEDPERDCQTLGAEEVGTRWPTRR